MALYHVTMIVKTTMTLPIEAADKAEARELAMEMPIEEIHDTVPIEDFEVVRRVTDVSETAPIDSDDPDPLGIELYGDRPVDDDDDFPQDDDARPGYDY
jgi:hypothetical protein